MSPERIETLGIVLVVIGAVAAAVGVGALGGWPWSLIVAASFLITGGVLSVRAAALTPPAPGRERGGEAQ